MLTPPCPRLGGLLRLGGACLLSLAAALPRGTALAQTEHRVGLGVGYSHHAVMDTAATSLAYDGHLAATSLTYQGENGRVVWTARLGAAFGHMQATGHAGRTIRFVSREVDGGDVGLEPGREMYAVYVSTTPNPTSGYIFFVDVNEVKILDMTVEDGLKLVISMGLVFPDQPLPPAEERDTGQAGERRRKT